MIYIVAIILGVVTGDLLGNSFISAGLISGFVTLVILIAGGKTK